jgi:nucleoside permease NupC
LALASVGTMVVDDFSMSPATTSWMNARTMMLAGVLGLVMLPLAWFTIGQGIRRRRAGRTT